MISNQYVVVATVEEFRLIQEEQKNHGLSNQLQVIVTGIGALNVMQALRNFDREKTYIYNLGYCGCPSKAIGTRVEVRHCAMYHPNIGHYEEPTHTIDYAPNSAKVGGVVCYTSSDFVTQPSIQDAVYDMELAFILGLGFKNVWSVKYVSDNCNIDEYNKTTLS